ncbi:MAG: 3-phosphoshikimate 1-carboxyvinyltransferase [Acidaminobacteraceae bacterium]
MKIKLTPQSLNGEISPPPSKSLSHRAIIAAGLSSGVSKIDNIALSDDIIATCDAMENFGVVINRRKNKLEISSSGKLRRPIHPVNCNESGSTLRFMIPLSTFVDEPVVYDGVGGLRTRPLDPYVKIFKEKDVRCIYSDQLPMIVEGQLTSGRYEIAGDVSSQFITGLMYVLPLIDGDSEIVLTSNLESKSYVDLTIDTLSDFGVNIINHNYEKFEIKGGQSFVAKDHIVESDFSQAAFWIVGAILGGSINLNNINLNSLQGDREILDIVRRMGAELSEDGSTIKVSKSMTRGTVVDASQCPDIIPVVTVLAALSEGTTIITNGARLRIKESDRLKSICTELNKLGASIVETEDGLVIEGKNELGGGEVDSWDDHRIVMSLAIASIKCKNPVVINGYRAIDKSYPNFFEDFAKLGGEANIL